MGYSPWRCRTTGEGQRPQGMVRDPEAIVEEFGVLISVLMMVVVTFKFPDASTLVLSRGLEA